MLNVCLALASLLGSAWAARAVGSEAYLAGAIAMASVGVAASLALLLSFLQSRQSSTGGGVSSVLLAMFVRMGLPMGVLLVMQGLHSPLLEAGFMGLLVLNYLVALPLETLMSLKLLRESNPKGSITKVSGRAVSG
ncbi:MAG: hypothetical protein GXP24_04500 [Planctomycetes bacterium]|nr:hypothetical protein [Planctomycetota bacterium]